MKTKITLISCAALAVFTTVYFLSQRDNQISAKEKKYLNFTESVEWAGPGLSGEKIETAQGSFAGATPYDKDIVMFKTSKSVKAILERMYQEHTFKLIVDRGKISLPYRGLLTLCDDILLKNKGVIVSHKNAKDKKKFNQWMSCKNPNPEYYITYNAWDFDEMSFSREEYEFVELKIHPWSKEKKLKEIIKEIHSELRSNDIYVSDLGAKFYVRVKNTFHKIQ